MQDEMIGGGSVTNGPQVTISAMIVDWLRDAAYAEIRSAAEALDTFALSRDREAHPEWFRGPAQSLKLICALLDTIGWAKSVPPVAVQIDTGADYCWALMRTIQGAPKFADDDAGETVCGDVEQPGSTLAHNLQDDRVAVLWDFIADARAGIDELAVAGGEGEGFVLDIAA
jgi:hypothetical protein